MGKSFLFNSRLCVTPTVASRAETDTSIESIEQLVSNYANSWTDVMYDGNVFPQNYIKVVNSSNEIVAYEVSFCDRFTLEPMGYVVLSTDLSLENPVIEYTLDGNDIYSQQSVNNPSELSINHFEDMYSSYDNILISDNMITYSTAEAGSNAVYSIPCYPSANSGPTITGGLTSGTVGTVKKTYCIEGSSELSFYRGIDFENSGVNCAPTALTNLVFYYDSLPEINGLIYNNPLWTYSRICSLAGFDGTRGLYNDEMIDALEEYVNERNFNISIDDYWKDWWSDFTRDINNDQPVLVSIQGNNSSQEWVAHAVVALGYVETDGDKYLRVADGLTTSQRYLNYDYYGVHEGVRVRIS